MVQSNKYYKSHTVGVTSEVGLTTDRDLSVLIVKQNVFYYSEIPEVTWYEPLYNNTKLHLMVRIQFWRPGKYGVPLHCHYSQVYFD